MVHLGCGTVIIAKRKDVCIKKKCWNCSMMRAFLEGVSYTIPINSTGSLQLMFETVSQPNSVIKRKLLHIIRAGSRNI